MQYANEAYSLLLPLVTKDLMKRGEVRHRMQGGVAVVAVGGWVGAGPIAQAGARLKLAA